MGVILVYKPTYIWGGPHPVWRCPNSWIPKSSKAVHHEFEYWNPGCREYCRRPRIQNECDFPRHSPWLHEKNDCSIRVTCSTCNFSRPLDIFIFVSLKFCLVGWHPCLCCCHPDVHPIKCQAMIVQYEYIYIYVCIFWYIYIYVLCIHPISFQVPVRVSPTPASTRSASPSSRSVCMMRRKCGWAEVHEPEDPTRWGPPDIIGL